MIWRTTYLLLKLKRVVFFFLNNVLILFFKCLSCSNCFLGRNADLAAKIYLRFFFFLFSFLFFFVTCTFRMRAILYQHFIVLDTLYIKSKQPSLCKQNGWLLGFNAVCLLSIVPNSVAIYGIYCSLLKLYTDEQIFKSRQKTIYRRKTNARFYYFHICTFIVKRMFLRKLYKTS